MEHLALRVNALGISIDLQPLLRHLGIPQEFQRHPDQVTLDLIELLPHFFRRHEGVVEMALLEFLVAREEGFIIVERFDCTIN